jgi:hypothetical protein
MSADRDDNIHPDLLNLGKNERQDLPVRSVPIDPARDNLLRVTANAINWAVFFALMVVLPVVVHLWAWAA